jgi:hypothetical protein
MGAMEHYRTWWDGKLTSVARLPLIEQSLKVTSPPLMLTPPPCETQAQSHFNGAMEVGSWKVQIASTHGSGSIAIDVAVVERHVTSINIHTATLPNEEGSHLVSSRKLPPWGRWNVTGLGGWANLQQ